MSRATHSRPRLRLATALAAAPLLLAAAGCGTPQTPSPNGLVIAMERGWLRLDPRVATDQGSSRILELAFNGLATKEPDGTLVPDLAASWEVLDAGRRYRFHLREGVTFHDGRPFTAADVEWTYSSLLDGRVPSPKRGALTEVTEIEIVDPMTVDIVLSEPNAAMLTNFTSYMGVVPAGTEPEDSYRRPIGTGPFRVVDVGTERVVMEPYERFHFGAPEVQRVVLRHVPDATVRALELEKGSVDLVINDLPPDVLERFRRDPDFRVVEDPGSNWAYLGVRLEDPVLGDVRVRRAMLHAIDRQRLVDTLWRGLGVVTETPLRPGFWATNEAITPTPFDPEAARRLLDEAGHPDPDGNGPAPRFTVEYKTSTDATALLQAQILQAMLADVGIAVEIRSHEFATFYEDVKSGNFRLYSMIFTGVVDPDFLSLVLHSERVPPNGANRVRYRNPELDRLLEAGLRPTDRAGRLPHYLAAQEIVARDLPYLSLFVKKNFAVMRAGYEGYRNFPSGEYHSVKWIRPPGATPGAGTP